MYNDFHISVMWIFRFFFFIILYIHVCMYFFEMDRSELVGSASDKVTELAVGVDNADKQTGNLHQVGLQKP